MAQIKVTYRERDGYLAKAYIDDVTGIGVNKHTDEPLVLKWSTLVDDWIRIDKEEYEYNCFTGEWNLPMNLPEVEPHVRIQPKKKQSRKKRNHGRSA